MTLVMRDGERWGHLGATERTVIEAAWVREKCPELVRARASPASSREPPLLYSSARASDWCVRLQMGADSPLSRMTLRSRHGLSRTPCSPKGQSPQREHRGLFFGGRPWPRGAASLLVPLLPVGRWDEASLQAVLPLEQWGRQALPRLLRYLGALALALCAGGRPLSCTRRGSRRRGMTLPSRAGVAPATPCSRPFPSVGKGPVVMWSRLSGRGKPANGVNLR